MLQDLFSFVGGNYWFRVRILSEKKWHSFWKRLLAFQNTDSGGEMIHRAERDERRGSKRFHASTRTFAVLGPNAAKVGRVMDISMSGLGFRHVDKEESFSGLNELDVFMIDDHFHVNKIPFEAVSDYEIKNEGFPTFMKSRQSGLRFGELTPGQRSLLEYFIQNHTLGEL
jgi:hypothetical protein